ncbi:uncharacterized protein CLUP02_14006 [Colletotrichum lupini]|uniref:Uncharacterized protein n=1 Tax=Colletotrichum lupini TaxID=145971 RepID=A0A9Q8T3K2_9PEZI|nr:uncharacterized protein CLUP02_14006 [Colletotrichum lupini]UQC88482.1 hypothetical protein CLUP02_14006 [Colletotrichum lupini]
MTICGLTRMRRTGRSPRGKGLDRVETWKQVGARGAWCLEQLLVQGESLTESSCMLEMSGDFNQQEVGKEGRATGHDEFDGLGRKEHRCHGWCLSCGQTAGRASDPLCTCEVPCLPTRLLRTPYAMDRYRHFQNPSGQVLGTAHWRIVDMEGVMGGQTAQWACPRSSRWPCTAYCGGEVPSGYLVARIK